MGFNVVRITPPTGAEALKPRVLRELAKDVQQRLNSGEALRGEVSPERQRHVFEAIAFGDGMLVSSSSIAPTTPKKLEEMLYPRTSLDAPIIRDTVSAAVGESLSGLDALLERARP